MQRRAWVQYDGTYWLITETGKRAHERNAKTAGIDSDGKGGSRLEHWFAIHLNSKGWKTHIAIPHRVKRGRFWKTLVHDFWGVGDIVGFHEEKGLWIVAQCGTDASSKKAAMEKFCWPPNTIVVIVVPDRRVESIDSGKNQARVFQLRSGQWEELPELTFPTRATKATKKNPEGEA